MDQRREMKMESLQRQLDYLDILEGRHVEWATNTRHAEARARHLDLADTFRQAREQCLLLFEMYQQDTG